MTSNSGKDNVKYHLADDGETIIVEGYETEAGAWLLAKKTEGKAKKALAKLSLAFRATGLVVYGKLVGNDTGHRAVRVQFPDAEDEGSVLVSMPDMEKDGNLSALDVEDVEAVKEAGLWNEELLTSRLVGDAPVRLVVTGEMAERLYAGMTPSEHGSDDVTYTEACMGKTAYYLRGSARAKIHALAAGGNKVVQNLLAKGVHAPSVRKGA